MRNYNIKRRDFEATAKLAFDDAARFRKVADEERSAGRYDLAKEFIRKADEEMRKATKYAELAR